VGDAVPEERRGAAMGLVMSAFSLAMIAGVPCGLYLAQHWTWHVPFFALAGLSAVILAGAAWLLPPMSGHLAQAREAHPASRVWAVMMERDHQMAFVFMAALTCAGALIFPYIPTYMVANTGMKESQVPFIYLVGGFCTFASMNLIGRWSDRSGKPRVFWIMSACAVVPIILFTHLHRVPFVTGIGVTTLLMICMSGRFVPAMAMVTASVKARYRGGFMSANSSVQQFSMGLATYVSGLIMGQTARGELTHFPVIGVISILCTLAGISFSRYLRPAVEDQPVSAAPIMVEHG
jgi:predicted MFS family arabinose efflux permease